MKTENWVNRASKIMPGGVSSPVRSMKSVGGYPIVAIDASGAWLRDADGRKFIDFCMSFGPLILGHSPKWVVDELEKQVHAGTSYGTLSTKEVELAELIVNSHPAVDWVRFVNSGTEAVMSAIRLARGHTGRNLIVKFDGTYHGHADSMLVKGGSGLATLGISSSAGVTEVTANETIVLSLADIDALKNTFEQWGDSIAAVIIEGIPANNGLLLQNREFMHTIQKLCKVYGALFILDEVITGYRVGLGGATDYYNLKPDIVTLGKIIGGGLPVGAYGGRRDLMEEIAPLGPVYQAGTLSGNPLAMVAGIQTLKRLKEDKEIYNRLHETTIEFTTALHSLLEDNGIESTIVNVASLFWPVLQDSHEEIRRPDQVNTHAVEKYGVLHRSSMKQGVYLPPSAYEVSFLSTAHSNEVLTDALSKIERGIQS